MKVRRHRCQHNLRKQPTFSLPPLIFPQSDVRETSAKNSLLMTHHYPDLGSAPDWLCPSTKFPSWHWVVMCHQCGISALVSWTSFRRETSVFFSKVKLAVLGAYLTVVGESPFLGGGGWMSVDIFFCKIKSSMTFSPKRGEV